MNNRSYPVYNIFFCLVDHVDCKLVESNKKFKDDYEANEYVGLKNKNNTNKLGFYRWQRVTFLDKY